MFSSILTDSLQVLCQAEASENPSKRYLYETQSLQRQRREFFDFRWCQNRVQTDAKESACTLQEGALLTVSPIHLYGLTTVQTNIWSHMQNASKLSMLTGSLPVLLSLTTAI